MKTTLEEISSVKKKLLVEIDPEEVNRKIDASYRELRKSAKIPGFRPGKAPRKILESYFSEKVEENVTRDLIAETFAKAIEQVNTAPLGPPLVEKEPLKPGKAFKYSALVEVRPEFELKNYIGVEVERGTCFVSDEEIRNQLDQIREAHGTLVTVEQDRPIREGDYAVLEYEGFEQERPLKDIRSTNFLIKVGSGEFHPDFETALIGLRKGDEKEINVHFEKDFRDSRVAGKALLFKVRIIGIKEMDLPELNDEFARGLGADFKDLSDLKERIKNTLVTREEERIDKEMKEALLQKISEHLDFELPQILVESEINLGVENIRQNLMRSGISMEKAGLSEEKVRNDLRPACEKRVKNMLILSEIANRESITINEEDLNRSFEELASSTGQDAETLRKYYEARNMIDSLRQKLLEEKTLNYLVEHAKILETKESGNNKISGSEKG